MRTPEERLKAIKQLLPALTGLHDKVMDTINSSSISEEKIDLFYEVQGLLTFQSLLHALKLQMSNLMVYRLSLERLAVSTGCDRARRDSAGFAVDAINNPIALLNRFTNEIPPPLLKIETFLKHDLRCSDLMMSTILDRITRLQDFLLPLHEVELMMPDSTAPLTEVLPLLHLVSSALFAFLQEQQIDLLEKVCCLVDGKLEGIPELIKIIKLQKMDTFENNNTRTMESDSRLCIDAYIIYILEYLSASIDYEKDSCLHKRARRSIFDFSSLQRDAYYCDFPPAIHTALIDNVVTMLSPLFPSEGVVSIASDCIPDENTRNYFTSRITRAIKHAFDPDPPFRRPSPSAPFLTCTFFFPPAIYRDRIVEVSDDEEETSYRADVSPINS